MFKFCNKLDGAFEEMWVKAFNDNVKEEFTVGVYNLNDLLHKYTFFFEIVSKKKVKAE